MSDRKTIQGLIPDGEPCSGMVRRYCGHCRQIRLGQRIHSESEFYCMTCHTMLPPRPVAKGAK